jgi:hypothetical protein
MKKLISLLAAGLIALGGNAIAQEVDAETQEFNSQCQREIFRRSGIPERFLGYEKHLLNFLENKDAFNPGIGLPVNNYDTNSDGKADVKEYFTWGTSLIYAFDLNNDGKFTEDEVWLNINQRDIYTPFWVSLTPKNINAKENDSQSQEDKTRRQKNVFKNSGIPERFLGYEKHLLKTSWRISPLSKKNCETKQYDMNGDGTPEVREYREWEDENPVEYEFDLNGNGKFDDNEVWKDVHFDGKNGVYVRSWLRIQRE